MSRHCWSVKRFRIIGSMSSRQNFHHAKTSVFASVQHLLNTEYIRSDSAYSSLRGQAAQALKQTRKQLVSDFRQDRAQPYAGQIRPWSPQHPIDGDRWLPLRHPAKAFLKDLGCIPTKGGAPGNGSLTTGNRLGPWQHIRKKLGTLKPGLCETDSAFRTAPKAHNLE